MEKEPTSVNLWIRADLETFNVETLELVPPGLREDYTRIMKQLAHAKGIAALALEQVYLAENERHAFFDFLIPNPDNVVELEEYRQRYE